MYKRKKWVSAVALVGMLSMPVQTVLTYAQQTSDSEINTDIVSESETTETTEQGAPPESNGNNTSQESDSTVVTPPESNETEQESEPESTTPIISESKEESKESKDESKDESEESEDESDESDETKEPKPSDVEWLDIKFQAGTDEEGKPAHMTLRYPNYDKFFKEFPGKHIPESFMIEDYREMNTLYTFIELHVKDLGDYYFTDLGGRVALKPEYRPYLYTKKEWDKLVKDEGNAGRVYSMETGEFDDPDLEMENDLGSSDTVTELEPDTDYVPLELLEVKEYTQEELKGLSLNELSRIAGYREIKHHVVKKGEEVEGKFINGLPYTLTRDSEDPNAVKLTYDQFGEVNRMYDLSQGLDQQEITITEGASEHPTLVVVTEDEELDVTRLKLGFRFYTFNNVDTEDPTKQYLFDLIGDEPIEGEPSDGEPNEDGTETPNEGNPNEGEPNEGEPNEGEPNEGEPNEGEPSEGNPNEGEPSEGNPNEGNPNEGEPSEGNPNEGEPSEGNPNEGNPNEGEPSEGNPNEGNPNEGEPSEGNPNEGEPNEGDPNQGEPNQGNPNEGYINPEQGTPTNSGNINNADTTDNTENSGESLESTGIRSPIFGVTVATLLSLLGGFLFVASSKKTKKSEGVADE